MREKSERPLVIHSNAGQDKTVQPPPPVKLVTKGKFAFLLGKGVSLTFLGISFYFAATFLLFLTVMGLLSVFTPLLIWKKSSSFL